MFFATDNLTKQGVAPCSPWEFKPPALPGAQIRGDKESRQDWYRSVSTVWNFYTPIEASNPNQRASKSNPPRILHGFAADYDLKLSAERIAEGINAMKVKPSWVERSLGGNCRLVWLFEQPLHVEDYDFCCFILDQATKWLALEILPGLDLPAFSDPTRLLCNGAEWVNTGAPAIPQPVLQAFFVSCGQEFKFQAKGAAEVPLDVVYKAILSKYPNFSWPTDFALESTGPTFWIAESTSSNSAILKRDGMFTFSAHATKPFYSWGEVLGPEFIKEFTADAIAKATTELFWDEKKFWRKKHGVYASLDMPELVNYLKCVCGLSAKPGNNGRSQIEEALNHIYSHNGIANAAPYVFRPPGVLVYQGKRRLNTYVHCLISPADGSHEWGEKGSFPFLSRLFDNLFSPPQQLFHFLAWWKYYYESGLKLSPAPGPVLFLMGGVGVGKTLINRELIGRSVGGFVDASGYIIKGESFNYQMFEVPHWCIDDDTVSDSPQAQAVLQSALKKSVANADFMINKKFHNSGMTEWMGRVVCTSNLDYISARMLGPLDGSCLDKISVLRCVKESAFDFPDREVTARTVRAELPNFLKWLVGWTPPEEVKRDSRFGFRAHQESTLLEQALQTSKIAPFKEILLGELSRYFDQEKDAVVWKGTVTQLVQTIHANPLNECVIRTLRLEQINRYLESVQKEGIVRCETETGDFNTRVWVFHRPEKKKATPAPAPESQQTTNNETPNPFKL